MREKWKPEENPLYKHLESSETNIFSERILSMLQEEMENGNEFAFIAQRQMNGLHPPLTAPTVLAGG